MSLRSSGGKVLTMALLGALALAAAGAGQVFFFSADRGQVGKNLDRAPAPDALAFKPYDRTPYFESLFFQFSSQDGTDFFCHWLLGDMGLGLKRYGMDFKVRYPDGKIHYWGGEFKEETTKLETGRFSWTMADNKVEGDLSTQRLKLKQDGLELDVAIKFVAPVFRAGDDGMIYLDAEKKDWLQITFLTCFTIEGTLKDGDKKLEVKGWGYGDRVRGNFVVTDFANLCSGLRYYKDGLGFITLEYQATEKLGKAYFPILVVHQNGKIVLVSINHQQRITERFTEPRAKVELPTGSQVEAKSGDLTARIEFKNVKLTDYNDPLKILSPVEKFIIQTISQSPLDMRFDGDVVFSLSSPAKTETREGKAFALILYSP